MLSISAKYFSSLIGSNIKEDPNFWKNRIMAKV